MNRAETLLVNSPPRTWLQRHYEVPLLQRLDVERGGRLDGAEVVEIGCGSASPSRMKTGRTRELGTTWVSATMRRSAGVRRSRRGRMVGTWTCVSSLTWPSSPSAGGSGDPPTFGTLGMWVGHRSR